MRARIKSVDIVAQSSVVAGSCLFQILPLLHKKGLLALTVNDPWLAMELALYIRSQHDRYRQVGRELTDDESMSLRRHLNAALLEQVRLVELSPSETVDEPAFYPELRRLGFQVLPDFKLMEAVTFDDVIVTHRPLPLSILFHELVHVAQYRLLGIERFAALYVNGYLQEGYDGIPLEVDAQRLTERFWRGELFDLQREVVSSSGDENE